MATPLPSQTIPLWPNGAPGSEDWTQSEQEAVVPESGLKVVWNVAQPSLATFLPPPDRATGTAVIVCPGGAFHFLAIKHEGTDAAPMFIALANDGAMAVRSSLPLYSAWRAAGHSSELHIFSTGGHGFGMRQDGLPSDHWIDLFGDWLKVQGLLDRPGER